MRGCECATNSPAPLHAADAAERLLAAGFEVRRMFGFQAALLPMLAAARLRGRRLAQKPPRLTTARRRPERARHPRCRCSAINRGEAAAWRYRAAAIGQQAWSRSRAAGPRPAEIEAPAFCSPSRSGVTSAAAAASAFPARLSPTREMAGNVAAAGAGARPRSTTGPSTTRRALPPRDRWPIVCRINNTPGGRARPRMPAGDRTRRRRGLAADGARSPRELEQCLRAIDSRARLGTMVETREAMRWPRIRATAAGPAPTSGLHDYPHRQRTRGLFEPMIDGTIGTVFREDYPGARRRRPPAALIAAHWFRNACCWRRWCGWDAFSVARLVPRRRRADGIADAIAAIAAEAARLEARSGYEIAADRAPPGSPSPWPRPARQRAARSAVCPGLVTRPS